MDGEVLVFGQFVLRCQKAEQFSSGAVFEEEVELAFILEAHFELDQEGMLDGRQDFLLGHDVFFLVLLEDVLLLEHFEGVELVVFELADEEHLGVGALADDGEDGEVLEAGSHGSNLLIAWMDASKHI